MNHSFEDFKDRITRKKILKGFLITVLVILIGGSVLFVGSMYAEFKFFESDKNIVEENGSTVINADNHKITNLNPNLFALENDRVKLHMDRNFYTPSTEDGLLESVNNTIVYFYIAEIGLTPFDIEQILELDPDITLEDHDTLMNEFEQKGSVFIVNHDKIYEVDEDNISHSNISISFPDKYIKSYTPSGEANTEALVITTTSETMKNTLKNTERWSDLDGGVQAEGSSYTTGIIISGYSLETKSEWRVPRNDGTGWIRECVYPNNPVYRCSEFNARY